MPSFDLKLVKERSKTISADSNLSVENSSFVPAGMLGSPDMFAAAAA